MQAAFDHLINQLRNHPQSDETKNAMHMLNTPNVTDIPTLIDLRMNHKPLFFDSMKPFVDFRSIEIAFAVTVPMLDPDLWVNFVTYLVTQIRGQQLKQLQQQQLQQQQLQQQQLQQQQLQQQQLQQQQLQQQQLQQQQPHQQTLTPEQYASRRFAASPSPDRGRLTPFAVSRRDGSHNLDQIKARLYTVISDETRSEQCIKLIMNVMKRELEPITDAEYVRLFGSADSIEPLVPVVHILFELFKDNGFDQTRFDEAFKYACHAYLHAEHDDRTILSNLKRTEPEPKQLYVIARLMRHFLTVSSVSFDRMEGHHLGGKKSRSKKRGRKSVHRRKKSSHKKRKSKKN
jgi:hypothetical protein